MGSLGDALTSMKRNRPEHARMMCRILYETTMRWLVGGAWGCASFSSASSALHGPADVARCAAEACAGNKNVAPAASATRYSAVKKFLQNAKPQSNDL